MFILKDNQFVLFKNAHKRANNHPNLFGYAKPLCPHCKKSFYFEMFGFGKKTKENKPMIQGSMRKPEDNAFLSKKLWRAQQVQKTYLENKQIAEDEKYGDKEYDF